MLDWLRENRQMEITEFDVGYNIALADVKQFLEQNKGKWEIVEPQTRFGKLGYKCSRCGKFSFEDTNFCPHCGVRMDGDVND